MKLTKSKIISIVAAALGIVAIFMLLLVGLTAEGAKSSDLPSVFNLMFGSGKIFDIAGVKIGTVNIILLISFILLIAGIALVVVGLFKDSKILPIAAITLFVVAGILFFLTKSVAHLSFKDKVSGMPVRQTYKKLIEEMKLGIGAILAGIMSILAGVATAVGTFVIKD